MAYTNAWDEAAPAGSADADTLDTIIQAKMKDMRERLEDAFPDWSDDAVDPKKVVVNSGTLANRPAVADSNTGEGYFATDTGDMYFFDGTDWIGGATADAIGMTAVNTYNDALGAGSKEVLAVVIDQVLTISFTGTTDGSGDVTIDTGELTALNSWNSAQAFQFQPTTPATLAQVVYSSNTASILTLRCYDYAGVALGTTAVTFYVTAYFGSTAL
jgi:hypothetical protein